MSKAYTRYSHQSNSVYGSSVAAFKNFIEAKEADLIAYPKDHNFTPINKYSIDPAILTKRCGCDVLEIDINEFSGEEKLFETDGF